MLDAAPARWCIAAAAVLSLLDPALAQGETEIAQVSVERFGTPTLVGDRVAWGARARDRGLDVFARAAGGPTMLLAHDPPLPVAPRHDDELADLSVSATHVAVLHEDTSYTFAGKIAYEYTAGFELRAGSQGQPLSTVLRCESSAELPSFQLEGSLLAYGPADCPATKPASVVVGDLAGDREAVRLPQPAGAVAIGDLQLAGRYLGFVRHFGNPDYSDTASEVVVVDLEQRTEVLVLREGVDLPDAPEGFALQRDGKVALAFGDRFQPGPTRLGWASPANPAIELLPVKPQLESGFGGLAMAGDRIAFGRADDGTCGRTSVAVTDLWGNAGRVGPAGIGGSLRPGGFDGRFVAWLNGDRHSVLSPGSLLVQDLAQDPLEAWPPPCRALVPSRASLAAPSKGVVSPRGRLRLRGSCRNRAGAQGRPAPCDRWIFLRRPGDLSCRRFGRPPPTGSLLGRPRKLSLKPGRSSTVVIPLLPRTLARLKRGRAIRAVAEWCAYESSTPWRDPVASLRLRLRLRAGDRRRAPPVASRWVF